MKLLIKFPSRSRPDKLRYALSLYAIKCVNRRETSFLITLDDDDLTMSPDILEDLHVLLEAFEHRIILGKSENKIHAINRDMDVAPPHDILLLASDDMLPEKRGYDELIRGHMREFYPDTDGVLWYNDGYAGNQLNTLVCMGKAYYDRFGYIYNPAYKSFFCDNEFTDVAEALKKQTYFPLVIIRHSHPANNTSVPEDELYQTNKKFWVEDEATYYRTKVYTYDVSVLICSLEERKDSLTSLLKAIDNSKNRSSLRVEVLTLVDDYEMSVGEKRQKLIKQAQGKYCCFIDDDDRIAPDYFQEIEKALQQTPDADCLSLVGLFSRNGKPIKKFYHTIEYTEYSEDKQGFYRPPNHLNVILTRHARRVGFQYKNHGEDTDFAVRMARLKLLKKEGKIDKPLYFYNYVSDK
jgi:hypothetical protein